MENLKLKNDGKLIETYWEYDEVKEEGSYLTREIKSLMPHYLHELPFDFEEGVTLRTLFEFMDKDLDYWDIVVGNWCAELVNEGLKDSEEKPEDIYFLELGWQFEKDHIDFKMDFSGIGKVYNSYPYEDATPDNSGNSYGIEFLKANDLADLPLKINTEAKFWDYSNGTEDCVSLGNMSPTLFQAVYSIIWELTFCGSPEDREDKHNLLKESIDEVTKELSQKEVIITSTSEVITP